MLGFQYLFESYTGLRTEEVLGLRTDAGPEEPGYMQGNSLCVRRVKGQELVNPYATMHEGLATLLKAHKKWKKAFYPDSPFYFPSYWGGCVDEGALSHALRRLAKKGHKKLKSHGARAFYVTVRRSQGATDAQIAFEIGHTSGGVTLAGAYGGVPESWRNGGGPKLKWLPAKKPAWTAIKFPPVV